MQRLLSMLRHMLSQAGWWIGVGATIIAVNALPKTLDDAYITFRYVNNFVAGKGLVYNAGEHVLGTTTILYTLLLALARWLTHADTLEIAWVINAGCSGVVCWLLWGIGVTITRDAGPTWQAAPVVAALLWALSPTALQVSLGGMETPFFTVLLLGAILAQMRGYGAGAILLAGLLSLTRPEGLLLLGLLVVDDGLRLRQMPWRALGLVSAGLMGYVALATRYYGNPIPQSVQTKSHAGIYQVTHWWSALGQGGMDFSTLLVGPWFPWLSATTVTPMALVLAVAQFALVGLGISWILRQRRAHWLAAMAGPTYISVYVLAATVTKGYLFPWYWVPAHPLLLLALTLGGARVLGVVTRPGMAVAMARVGAVAMVALLLASNALTAHLHYHVLAPVTQAASDYNDHQREDTYRMVAAWLNAHAQPGDVVAASEIGVLGYYYPGPILDTVGLVSPRALAYYPLPASMLATNNAIPPRLIDDTQPAYVVSLDIFTRRSLAPDVAFQRQYTIVYRLPCTTFGSQEMLVWQRVAG